MDERKLLEEIYRAAIRAVDPYRVVASQTDYVRSRCMEKGLKRIVPIALGKAACKMALGLCDSLGNLVSSGIAVTKYGHCQSVELPLEFAVFEAGHPVPDENSVAAAQAVIELAAREPRDGLIVCLISGGGSSLLALPAEGITLGEKQHLISLLLKAGAGIDELNCVRKHISRIKGGRVAQMLYPASVVSLIISDVIGDRIDVIASGPTAPDASTYRDALDVLGKYRVQDQVPLSVLGFLDRGARGLADETPKKGDVIFDDVENRVIANNSAALTAAAEWLRASGYPVHILASDLQGEARDAGRELAQKILGQKIGRPACFLSGGETTVKVRGSGFGGRNTELALGFALAIEQTEGVFMLSAGTDGDDNSTGAAGAMVDASTVARARNLGLDPGRFLENNDSHTFFRLLNDLFITGPTGTNVMDIQIALRTH
jgi:glycerate 2-kinase